MELYLQFGYGMMEHSRHLLRQWGGGSVVLSPRDLDPDQLQRLASDLGQIPGGQTLLDPQFFLPHADHTRLCSHEYWPQGYDTSVFWQGAPLQKLLADLLALNQTLGCSAFILPGLLATSVDDLWFASQESILNQAAKLEATLPVLSTIALSADASRSQDQVAALLERSERWQPSGYYVVCEHPGGDYLVQDPAWLANILDLVAGLRLRRTVVIVGYCNHQMLALAAAKPTALCSGTWMNVRSFPPDKFRSELDEEIQQRATWYYCPQALSEYKVPFLDIAHRQGLLAQMAAVSALDGGYAAGLFSGPQPSSVPFTEQSAFRHYLHALHGQVSTALLSTFDDTVAAHEALLDAAERLLLVLAGGGVRGQMRDFRPCIDVNRAALSVISATRGPVLRREWASM
jgi:hypothetical protein